MDCDRPTHCSGKQFSTTDFSHGPSNAKGLLKDYRLRYTVISNNDPKYPSSKDNLSRQENTLVCFSFTKAINIL